MPVNVRPTRADREIARVIARNTTPATEETVLTWGADEHVLCAAACRLVAVLPRKACARARGEQSYFDHHHCGDHWTYSCWRTGRAMSRPDLHSARRSNVSFGCSRATAVLKARERWACHFHRPDRMRFTCASTCKTCSRLGDLANTVDGKGATLCRATRRTFPRTNRVHAFHSARERFRSRRHVARIL